MRGSRAAMGNPRWAGLALGVVLGVASAAGAGSERASAASHVERGDAAWARRAGGESQAHPRPEPTLEAVAAYESALTALPGSLEVRWKLLRALHFAGAFAAANETEAADFYDRARRVAEDGIDRLARRVEAEDRLEALDPGAMLRVLEAAAVPQDDVARLYFWSAINWGAWSRTVGLLGAVRQGVANRLFRYTSVALALEPGYDDGGALRLLGRLHATLPRVPFVSDWVDRDQALPLVERAYALAPANPGNRLLLALTLLDLDRGRRAEALDLLKRVAALEPRPSMRVEDLVMREEARERLSAELSRDAT